MRAGVCLALALAACAPDSGPQLVVSAAASLDDAFAALESSFEAANPGVDVLVNVAASSTLSHQIIEGAPIDVFASADTTNMQRVVAAGMAANPVIFATNRLQVAVPAGNPGGVGGVVDLARDELHVGLCAAPVPCGGLTRRLLHRVGVVPAVDTHEPGVRALVTKIAAGELDAGVVYVTDVLAGGDAVEGVDIADEVNVVAEYPIAALADAPSPVLAEAFVEFVRSDEGRAILAGFGFASP